jgi:CubicO group peptidase (beta-lactamase class C family)
MACRIELRIVVVLAVFTVLFSLAACAQTTTPTPGAVPNIGQGASPTVAPTPVAPTTPTPTQPGLPPYWPTEGWRTAPPEKLRMNPDRLEQMMAFIDEHAIAIDSVLVVRDGYIAFEAYRNGYDQHKPHHIQSATKSFTSTLIGIALRQGLIESVDQKLVEFFPDRDIGNMDARKAKLTLENLLTMSDGMDWHEWDYPYSDKRNTLGQMWVSRDAVQHVLDRPMARDPGEVWAYNSGTSILLGGIIEQATGGDVLSFAREYLFDPLGIGYVLWQKTTGNHYHTDGGLFLTPRDMARLGYLMLNNGTWDGREIVSQEWVARASNAHYQTSIGYGYGYQWWTLPGTNVYAATGHYEQKIYIIPEADMVVVFTGNVPDAAPHPTDGLLARYILPACTDLPDGVMRQRYAKHGFTFDYPLGFRATEAPTPGGETASDVSGAVQFMFDFYPLEIVNVVWNAIEAEAELEEVLEEFLALALAQSGTEIKTAGRINGMKDDHEVLYQTFTGEAETLQFAGVIGVWVCDEANREYIVTYVSDLETATQDLLTQVQGHLDSLACHETH